MKNNNHITIYDGSDYYVKLINPHNYLWVIERYNTKKEKWNLCMFATTRKTIRNDYKFFKQANPKNKYRIVRYYSELGNRSIFV